MIAQMEELEHLNIVKFNRLDGDFSTLSNHPSLDRISISGYTGSSDTLQSILRLEKLYVADIQDTSHNLYQVIGGTECNSGSSQGCAQ